MIKYGTMLNNDEQLFEEIENYIYNTYELKYFKRNVSHSLIEAIPYLIIHFLVG